MEIYDNLDKSKLIRSCNDPNNPLDLINPFRCLIIGRSGVGKTNLIYNIIKNNSCEYSLIYIFHCDEYTEEYNLIPHIKYQINDNYIEQFNKYRELPKLLIIDDVDYRNLTKKQKDILYKILTYTSTHCNLSILYTIQDITYIPRILRGCFNYIVLYKLPDMSSIYVALNRLSNILTKKEIEFIFNNFMKIKYDFILFDDINQKAYLNGKTLIK